jgi:hypothetical protein
MQAVGGESWLFQSRIEALFGPADSLPNLIAAGQYYGAEGLRYIYDALRRKGKHIGGATNHCYGEPWPNGAGSYMVDFDGRTLMNYDFLAQALAPISLSLKMDSILYNPEIGIEAELWLTSDAPQPATGLHAKWLARDRKGKVFDHGSVDADIASGEVKSLGAISLHPPKETIEGPVLVELRLEDASGKLLGERVQFFGSADVACPFAGFFKNPTQQAPVSAAFQLSDDPKGRENLAFVGNGAKPATASSALPFPKHQPVGINDGVYGNDHSWIGSAFRASFQIDLGAVKEIGRFRIGRDRTSQSTDRPIDYVKIETSADGQSWQTAFEQAGLLTLKDASPLRSLVICTNPAKAQFVRVTVDAPGVPKADLACVDEFEVFAPAKEMPGSLPQCCFPTKQVVVYPVGRTTLAVKTVAAPSTDGEDAIGLQVTNTGPMTALFCQPHPMLVYRTDLFIDNNNCFIPPGESRTIMIRAAKNAPCGLSLAETGWTVSTWNADDVAVAPSDNVVLTVGRRDEMCREFKGYADTKSVDVAEKTASRGNRPETDAMPYCLTSDGEVTFTFDVRPGQTGRAARLRIHTADQSPTPAVVQATINGRTVEQTLTKGLGIQRTEPSHLAFPATAVFELAPSDLHPGENTLTVRVSGDGWFSWDALELIVK